MTFHLAIQPDGFAAEPCAATLPAAAEGFEPWVDPAGRPYGFCAREGDQYYVRIHGVGDFRFSLGCEKIVGTPDPGMTPHAFHEAFCHDLLPYLLQRHSWEVLHASGLMMDERGIALCGESQVGKSTLAHAWRLRGGHVFADDAVPFQIEGASVCIRPIPFEIRARRPSLEYFGPAGPTTGLSRSGEEAARTENAPAGEASGVLHAIYLLKRQAREDGPVLRKRMSPDEALAQLLHQAYCFTLADRLRTVKMVENYVELVNRVPVYGLAYPTGLPHVQRTLDALAQELDAG